MKKQHINLLFTMLIITLVSCSKEDVIQDPVKSSAKQITSFVFKASENTAIAQNVSAVINETDKTISATVANGTNIKSLTPTIVVSDKAIAGQSRAKDFSSPVNYTITAEDGTSATYKVTVTIALNSTKQILSFVFKKEDNQLYGDETITATIDEANKTITATMSYSANAALLLPSIVVSSNASVSPDIAQDFSNPVAYTITAEDGTTTVYQILLEITFTDRDALISIYNANPDNTLGWDLQDKNISSWLDVELDGDGNVASLYLESKGLGNLPPEIGRLPNLVLLALDYNSLSSLPSEIVKLKNLVHLSMGYNQLNSFPSAIDELSKLQYLFLNGNQLTAIPVEIGKLSNLLILDLENNQLTGLPAAISQLSKLEFLQLGTNKLTLLPSEIGQLKSLLRLSLYNNQLTSLPKEIGGLTTLTSLLLQRNKLTSIPPEIGTLSNLAFLSSAGNELISISSEIGNLTSLTVLYLDANKLTSIPKEIGKLTSLTSLSITDNLLISLPQEVCKLEDKGTIIQLDSGVKCE